MSRIPLNFNRTQLRRLVHSIVFLFLLPSPLVAQPTTLPTMWSPIPIRSPAQAARGQTGGEGGQCLHSITRCRADDNRIYIAVDVVGIWRSKDAGASWTPCRQSGFNTLGATSIVANPTNPDELLAYADSPDWDKPRMAEEGLYRSTDAGETFTRVLACPNDDPRRGYRHLIDYSPDGKQVVFLSYKKGLFHSEDAGKTFARLPALPETIATEIRIDPRDNNTLYAATENGLQISHDAGKSFTPAKPLGDDTITAVSPDASKPGRLYAVSDGKGLLRSDDAGQTFTPLLTGDKAFDAKAYLFSQSPIDANHILLASFDKLYVSQDAGQSWKLSKPNYANSFVQQGGWGFFEGYAWSYKNADKLIASLSCGLYASDDAGLTFADSMSGFTGFHHGWCNSAVSFAAADPKRFAFFCYDYAFVFTEDAGHTFRRAAPKEKVRGWTGMYAGDMSPDWKNNPIVIAAAGNYWKNQLVRSEDAGQSWKPVPNTDGAYFFVRFHPTSPSIVYADNLRSNDSGKTFKRLDHPIIALAPSQPDTVYAYADGQVLRSNDTGNTWTALPNPPIKAGDNMGRRSLEVDPRDPNRIIAMTPPDAALFDGQSWTTIPASTWAPKESHPFANRFAFDPDHADRIVLGLDAAGASYLYLSDDAGKTWHDITCNLMRLGPNQSLNIQPGTGKIFIGAGFGTWTTSIPYPQKP